MSDTVH